MFTLKHINIHGGETLYEGTNPTFANSGSTNEIKAQMGMQEVGMVSYTDNHGETQILHGGTVFVMNESGKTVAKYVLEIEAPLTGFGTGLYSGQMASTANPRFGG